uniref:Uncharacterized protein n=1 Tax=Cacopsylla melanoneura TaxID=428564 RepID=A0A8D8VZ03_9HEMI
MTDSPKFKLGLGSSSLSDVISVIVTPSLSESVDSFDDFTEITRSPILTVRTPLTRVMLLVRTAMSSKGLLKSSCVILTVFEDFITVFVTFLDVNVEELLETQTPDFVSKVDCTLTEETSGSCTWVEVTDSTRVSNGSLKSMEAISIIGLDVLSRSDELVDVCCITDLVIIVFVVPSSEI